MGKKSSVSLCINPLFLAHNLDSYDKNRLLVLSTLASNVTAQDGYFNGSTGVGPDRVYAMGMCAPGAAPGACSSCINDATGNLLQGLSEPDQRIHMILCQGCISGAGLRGHIGVDALHSRCFFRRLQTLLESSVDYYKRWYPGKRGVIILRPSCFFRWELYRFSGAFDSATNATSPPPSPPSSVTNQANIQSRKANKRISGGVVAAIVIVIVVAIILIALGIVIFKRRKQNQANTLQTESVKLDLKTIEAATSNFAESNKLGEGGFGDVFKGVLPDGTEVAVKRLSKTSGQGETEFKNEVLVVAKLQHRNLVRLLGYSLEGEEKLLVYEFVSNKSLDYFLFDSMKRAQLDWTVRHKIINGITRGILYLHQDSRLTIIHRDLKASNILLDAKMNPKISDFGMARIFEMDQGGANTRRVVGTFGYMSPEYVNHGEFSTKSDVYSFGVLILEIISGKKNSSFHRMDGSVNNLVTYVWKLWKKNSLHELTDPSIQEECIGDDSKKDEVIRCIHIGLLCVQENPTDRPAMSEIHQMLTNSSLSLHAPKPPGFFFPNGPGANSLAQESGSSQFTSKSFTCSVDDVTITSVNPR
ncbi:unnamed protein product [Microthlaspi erraticum]|uniref:Protein kinase domain-containing protein n=1 Tax=Microthlaspi erraticum TaxID=1685480 RepID=A0A6D2J369_9BRAS|nr:unnamed protein product [Microthlaspi erraticum]